MLSALRDGDGLTVDSRRPGRRWSSTVSGVTGRQAVMEGPLAEAGFSSRWSLRQVAGGGLPACRARLGIDLHHLYRARNDHPHVIKLRQS